jgi:hypothetical protein
MRNAEMIGASATKLHFGASDTGTWSIKNSSPQERRSAEKRNRESTIWISARSPLVVTWSKSCREKLEAASSFFGVSEIATWRVEMPHNRIAEMPKCETRFGSACGHNHWSHRRKMEEGASADKLHFRVSGIGTWRVTNIYHGDPEMPKCEMEK